MFKIFVGTDRSQKFAVRVLEHSIRRKTESAIEVIPLDNAAAQLPQPADLRHGSRTGFSFARFAIPKLNGYRGRAIYLDADMLVFSDIAELWNWDFARFALLIMEEPTTVTRRRRRVRQCSVMVIDCEQCLWDPAAIVNALGRDYSYEQLMYELCIVPEERIGAVLPARWNSLEHYDETTSLLHYTDMQTQPWVEPANPNGYLWVNELRLMLEDGTLSPAEIDTELAAGYLRPSLTEELRLPMQTGPLTETTVAQFRRLDESSGFIKHRAVNDSLQRRREAVRAWEHNAGLWHLLKSPPSSESTHPLARMKYILHSLAR